MLYSLTTSWAIELFWLSIAIYQAWTQWSASRTDYPLHWLNCIFINTSLVTWDQRSKHSWLYYIFSFSSYDFNNLNEINGTIRFSTKINDGIQTYMSSTFQPYRLTSKYQYVESSLILHGCVKNSWTNIIMKYKPKTTHKCREFQMNTWPFLNSWH